MTGKLQKQGTSGLVAAMAAVWLASMGACSSSPAATNADAGAGSGGTGGLASGGTGGRAAGGSGGSTAGGSGGGAGGGGTGGSVVGTGGRASGGASGSGGTAGNGVVAAGGVGGFGYAGPSRCATAGVPLCENFENGLDTTLWNTTRNGDASVVVDSLHAARGTKALHVTTTAGNGFAFITETRTFPPTANILFGRMFVWFGDDITTTGHFSLAEGGGTGTAGVARFGGQFMDFGVGTDGGASGDWTDHDNRLIPSKTWICAEFEFKGDTNEFHVWWDDVERTALRSGPTQHPGFTMPAFNHLWFGWWMYNMVEPQELWIDEIAVDYKPIGCTK